MDDIIIEEMEPLETITSVSMSHMTLTVYKPLPTSLNEYFISDTIILSAFSTLENILFDDKI